MIFGVCWVVFFHSEALGKIEKKPKTTRRGESCRGLGFSVGVEPQEQEGGTNVLSISKKAETEEI